MMKTPATGSAMSTVTRKLAHRRRYAARAEAGQAIGHV
jgi:hypothetical protein